MFSPMNWHYLLIEQRAKYYIIIFAMMLFSLPIQSQKIVINEINYRSVEIQQDIEFVELHNAETTSVNLSGWSLTEGVTYQFPAGTTIPANGYIVVCADPATCQSVLGFSGAVGPYAGGLSGKGDEVILRNNLFEEVDKVDYESWQEWPNIRFNNDGDSPASIQKMHPELPGQHGGSWTGQAPTPGTVNSNYNANWTDIAVVKSVSKSPDHPVSGEDVRIKAELRNLDLLSNPVALELQYQIVDPGSYIHKSDAAYNSGWVAIPMLDDGVAADSTANNGTYTAAIPGSVQIHRRLIRYRIKMSSPAYTTYYPDQNHPESNYAYYVYDGYPLINGFDINAVNPIQDVTIITGNNTANTYIGPGTGIDNTGQYTGYEYLGEGTLVYNGKVHDHVRFRPRGRTNGRAARVKPGVKFKLNKERQIAPDNDCGDEYDEEQDALTLSGTYVNDITTHGATESMIHKILNLTGAMGRHVDYTQFRVVDEVNENDNTGDFWGVFLILENYDGDYMKEHGLPDGNIWRHKRSGTPAHRMTYQGDFPNTNNIGDWSSHHPQYAGFVDRYLNHNVTSSYADWEFFINDKIANNFFANGANNYEGKHAQREYYNSETGKWRVWYGDYDTTFGMNYDDGTFFERSASSPNISVLLVQEMSGVWTQYQNEMRSAYDLLLSQEQADFLVDMESRKIYDPGAAYDWTDLDHSRWNQNYDLGNVDAQIAWYKTWFQNRGDYLKNSSTDGFYDNKIPYTPTISLAGSGALDDMTFDNSNFGDPQGAGTFSALEWRVGEWSDPSNPYYANVCDPIYEIETVWRSGEINSFSSTYTIPPEAYLKADRTYKIRVRYKDNTGRWSHWSAPEEVIPTPATQMIPNVVINEIMYNPLRGCGNEFIEIINAESFPVDMRGFEFTEGIGFQFPKDKIMQPNEILVLAKDSVLFELKYGFSPYGDFSSSLSNDGEKIILAGPYDTVVDSLTYNDKRPWDEAPDGEGPSLELLDVTLDNADPISWFRSKDNCGTPGQPNSRLCSGTPLPIVINEINYNSPNSPDAGDWVELHNTTTAPVDISNWGFYDGVNEFLVPAGTVIESEDFMVLTQNDTLFSATFPHLTTSTDYIGNFGFSLSGGGERVTLFDNNDCLTDYVNYDDDLPWDTIPDGNGPTLSLIDPLFDNTNYNSWESSSNINSAFGTPGRANEPCPELSIVFPNTICATIPIVLRTDTLYDDLSINWFVQGVGLIQGNTVNAVWNTPGNYNVQLITDYFECRKVSNMIITVLDCNLVPELVDDNFTTNEDTALSDNVLTNDSDPDPQDNLTVNTTPVTSPTNGTVVLNADGSFTYTPNPDFNGLDTFEYEACDDGDPILCETALVEINVIPVNDAPVAVDDTEVTQEDTDLVSDVLPNDSDVDGDPLTASVVTQPANGTLVLNPDGTYTYTPNPDFNGTDSFEYEICDTGTPALCDTAVVNITVEPVNDAPIATDDSYTTLEDTPLSDNVSLNDSDVDNSIVVTTIPVTPPANGTLVLNADGTFIYTPNPDFNGTDSFEYEICDNGNPALCDTAIVTIDVAAVNDAPIAVDDTEVTPEDTDLVSSVLPNDSDVDGDNLSVNITPITPPQNGSLTLLANGSYAYTPNADFNGTDSFEYEVCDDGTPALCDIATVNITIEPVNDAPIAVDDSYTTLEDTPLSDDVSLNDSDVDHPIVVTTTQVTPPANGIAFLNADGTFTYTPNPDFNGIDSFEYEICDAGAPALCDTAVVTINVGGVNDAPIAVDDTETTPEDTDLVSDVLPNDSDVDGDPLTASVVTAPVNGTLALNPNGTYTYTPNPDFNGTDSFEYEICDNATPALCDMAIVNITIVSVNDAPIIVDDSYNTLEDTPLSDDVSLNDSDVDHPIIVTTTPVTPPANGTLVLNADGTFTYTPNPDFNGTDSFEYEVCDGGTPALCDTATVTIDVGAINDAPIAIDDTETTQEDTDLVSDVLPNDSDVDGDPLTASVVTAPVNGTLALNPNGTYTYTPNPDFNGTDSFEYEICDNATPALCDMAIVNITIVSVNDAPVAVDDAFGTIEDTPLTDNVILNDSDVDHPVVVTTTPVTPPANGTLVLNADGTFTYTPNPNFNGTDSFEYEICDGGTPALCDTATVMIGVGLVNDAPVAVDDTEFTQEDVNLMGDVLLNDSDADGDPLTAIAISSPANGTVTLNSDGTYTYVPNANFNGTDSFEYAACDNGTPGLCDFGLVTITIEPVNDAPIAVDDIFGTSEDTPITDDISLNDTDVDHSIVITTPPITPTSFGTLILNSSGQFTYTPNSDFNGTDSFEYEICDGGTPALCDTALVQIVIGALNDAPIIAQNLSDAILEDTPLSSSVMNTASDPDGDALTANLITGPTNGTLVLNPDGTYDYVPDPDFNGTDTFTYEICDDGLPVLCTTSQVTITISPVNDTPIAVVDTVYTFSNTSVQDNILLNDWDVDGDNLATAIIPGAAPTNGTITLLPNGNIDYTPDPDYIGTDHYEYEVCDDGNPSLCNTTNITVIIDAGCVDINLKAFLEGPFDTGTAQMGTTLNVRGLLPGQTPVGGLATATPAGQPYNAAPWNYTGTEGANWTDADYDADVSDWVLVSFRTDIEKSDEIAMTAGLIDKNGTIEFPNRCALPFTAALDSLYIVIEHRNHMGIMSPVKVPVINSTITHDFRFSDSFRYSTGFGQKQLPSGIWTMYAGDINQMDMPSYDITGLDKVPWFENNGVFDIYLAPDLNFDGDINGADKALWIVNNGIASRVPK